jgi:hypothetical protein
MVAGCGPGSKLFAPSWRASGTCDLGATAPPALPVLPAQFGEKDLHLVEDLCRLFAAVDITTTMGCRDYAFGAVALETGLRADCELEQLKVSDVCGPMLLIRRGANAGRRVGR